MQYGVPFHRVVQILDNLPDEIIMVMDHRASAHQMKNWKEKKLLRSVVMDSVSYKPSSSLGSGFELVDRVYRLNSTHELTQFVCHTKCVIQAEFDSGVRIRTCGSSLQVELNLLVLDS